MDENPPEPSRPETPRAEKLSREDRLAAKLRENLRRRKAQARALGDDNPTLPKERGNS